MTSFAFMFVDVPAPPWTMSTTKCPWWCPSMTSWEACSIAAATVSGRSPSRTFARAAASFTIASARTSVGKCETGMPVIGKFSTARSVWTP